MTRKNAGILYRNQDLLKAYAEGREIEFKPKDEYWKPSGAFGNSTFSESENGCAFNFESYDYRIKPEPKLREWTESTAPVGALIMRKHWKQGGGGPSLILAASNRGVSFLDNWNDPIPATVTFADCRENCVCSTDHGKTWLPCGVTE